MTIRRVAANQVDQCWRRGGGVANEIDFGRGRGVEAKAVVADALHHSAVPRAGNAPRIRRHILLVG